MMGMETRCYGMLLNHFSEQTFTKHSQQILFNILTYAVHHTFYDECLKTFTASVLFLDLFWGHSGTVVTYLPPTSEVCGSNPGPYVGKLVLAY